MRFCSCALAHARLFMRKMLTYYIFSEYVKYFASFESNFSFLRQLMHRCSRTPPAWICVSAHARLRVRVYLWSKCWHIIYFWNLLEIMHRLRLILAFCDNFDFFAIFSPKFDDVIISIIKMLTYYIFSEFAWHSASFESNFSFLQQFWFFIQEKPVSEFVWRPL